MRKSPTEFPLIAEPETLSQLAARIVDAPVVALDTEFVRESTYFPELCVLQIATQDLVAAIDCLADVDLDPLVAALSANGRPWVLHSARQDLEVLGSRFGRLPGKLIDTQVAAALLGYPLQIGLQGLLQDLLGISLGKEHTRADWSRRPLSDDVLQYALDDVRYLLPAWRELSQQLEARGRRTWFEEDCQRLLQLPLQADAMTILERTKGAGNLKGKRRAAALALVTWREQRAIQRDKPRRWILADDQLVAIATALPRTPDDLARVPGLPPKLVARSGKALIAAVREAPPLVDEPDNGPADKAIVKSLQAQVRKLAADLGVQPELLATRKDFTLAATGKPPAAFTAGWRSEILGELAAALSSDQAS